MNVEDQQYVRDEVSSQIGRLRKPLEDQIEATFLELAEKYATLQTECHNFADEWTRKIEAIDSLELLSLDPTNIRKELASLLADFVRLSK